MMRMRKSSRTRMARSYQRGKSQSKKNLNMMWPRRKMREWWKNAKSMQGKELLIWRRNRRKLMSHNQWCSVALWW
uniref:Uncharacterized protein n=1 Tax=Arundo donax TaxID=35708 RepID=A0A0A9CUZ5_ARUDO